MIAFSQKVCGKSRVVIILNFKIEKIIKIQIMAAKKKFYFQKFRENTQIIINEFHQIMRNEN